MNFLIVTQIIFIIWQSVFLKPSFTDSIYPLTTEETTTPWIAETTSFYYSDTTTAQTETPVVYGSCDAQTDFPALTVVVDTTGSMSSGLSQLQDSLRLLLSRIVNGGLRQYTLMEFNDPSTGPLHITCSGSDLGNYISSLHASDGGDCPELAMRGLLQALQHSPSGTLFVLLTDASALDYDSSATSEIFALLASMKAKVFFMITGYCSDENSPDFLIYRNISSASYGHVFENFYYPDSNKVVDYVEFMLWIQKNSTTQLLSVDTSETYYSASFQVNSDFKAIILSTSGQIQSLQIIGPSGGNPEITKIVDENWGLLQTIENPDKGVWTITVNAQGFYSLRVEGYEASSPELLGNCSECHPDASCKTNVLIKQCTCNEGLVGDGYTCSDYDECSMYWSNLCNSGTCVNTYGSYNCLCPSGFELSKKTCIDIDECSRSDLNGCHSLAYCINYDGSYSCECPTGYFGNGYYCEINECTADVCGSGKECIKSSGSFSCIDPCLYSSIVDEPWRSTVYNYYGYYHYCYDYYYYYYDYYCDYYYYYYGYCDSYLSGWYRFTGSGGIRLPEFCPSIYSCHTTAPMWLSGSHPQLRDGIVNRTVCANWNGDCCHWQTNVQIKACPGGYHVYKFNGAPSCNLAYCTDPNTYIEPCNCGDDEECVYKNDHFGCECKSNLGPSELKYLRPELTCGANSIVASFKKCQIQKFNLNTETVHLIDSACVGSPDYNTTNLISVMTVPRRGFCGNQMTKNETHVNYINTIYLSLLPEISFGGEDIVSMTFSCAYPLDMQVSLETVLNPMNGTVIIGIEGTGQLLASIALYRDGSYYTPYEGSEVIVTAKTVMYIGVLLNGGDTNQFILVMRNCYAAPSRSTADTRKYYIIKDGCPSNQDSSIVIYENGVSRRGQFSVQLFKYIQNVNIAFIHCELHICDRTTESCAPSCTGLRSGRQSVQGITASVQVGPIVREVDSNEDVSSTNQGTSASVDLLTSAVLLLAGFLLTVFVN